MSVAKNGSGTIVAYAVLLAVGGLILFILGGYRADAQDTKQRVAVVEKEGANREADLRVLKESIGTIKADIAEIKRAVQRNR